LGCLQSPSRPKPNSAQKKSKIKGLQDSPVGEGNRIRALTRGKTVSNGQAISWADSQEAAVSELKSSKYGMVPDSSTDSEYGAPSGSLLAAIH